MGSASLTRSDDDRRMLSQSRPVGFLGTGHRGGWKDGLLIRVSELLQKANDSTDEVLNGRKCQEIQLKTDDVMLARGACLRVHDDSPE